MKYASSLILLALLMLAACRTPQPSLTWTGNASTTPSTSRPAREAPMPRSLAGLDLLDQQKQASSSLPAMLSGANKPNGLAMRYRNTIPQKTPLYVPRTLWGLDLFIADPAENGWFAFYRGECGSLGDVCTYRAALFDEDGQQRWNIHLNRFLQSDRYIEIQDIRYADNKVYFNEACATYSSEVEGRCSSLVRLDPTWKEVDWRTSDLVSNNIFILHDEHVIAGYGFTNEPDALYLINRETGRLEARHDLDSAHQYLEVMDGRLYVVTYESLYTFAL